MEDGGGVIREDLGGCRGKAGGAALSFTRTGSGRYIWVRPRPTTGNCEVQRIVFVKNGMVGVKGVK